jgi:uncharacterized membrane protein YfcA
MSLWEAAAIFAAGIGAGVVNAAVGSGTLITFPVLIAFGYAPVTANVSNTIGLVPGSLAGAYAYRRQLREKLPLVARLSVPSVLGGILGAVLLLTHPGAFKKVVPFFIIAALVLVVLGPQLARWMSARPHGRSHWTALLLGLFATGVYGGYFGAAQGIIVLSLLSLMLAQEPREVNGIKNVLVALVNLVSGIAFALAAHVAWGPAGLIAAGSVLGGRVGAAIAMRLPPAVFRIAIVGVATIALGRLLSSARAAVAEPAGGPRRVPLTGARTLAAGDGADASGTSTPATASCAGSSRRRRSRRSPREVFDAVRGRQTREAHDQARDDGEARRQARRVHRRRVRD